MCAAVSPLCADCSAIRNDVAATSDSGDRSRESFRNRAYWTGSAFGADQGLFSQCQTYLADVGSADSPEDTECCPPSAPPPKVPNPVAAPSSYRPTGRFEPVGDFKEVYTTGPDDAEHALIVIYDIFGFWETTLRVSTRPLHLHFYCHALPRQPRVRRHQA